MMIDQLKRKVFNFIFRVKYYGFHKDYKRAQNRIIIIFDEMKNYCGLADIIKAIVGVYYVAKQNGMAFKIYCKYPLDLSKYLQPASVDWIIEKNDINRCLSQTKLINYIGLEPIETLKKGFEYHVYNFLGKNILQNTKVENWEYEWHKLFNELFVPSITIEKFLKTQGLLNEKYVAVHVRFLNCLEIAEPTSLEISKPLDSVSREKLISCIFSEIDKLKERFKVVIFTDSEEFAQLSKHRGYHILEGNIGHLTYDQSEETTIKTFIDWFSISRAEKVYSLRGGPLYNSAFPIYASLIGNKEYNEINITNVYEG